MYSTKLTKQEIEKTIQNLYGTEKKRDLPDT